MPFRDGEGGAGIAESDIPDKEVDNVVVDSTKDKLALWRYNSPQCLIYCRVKSI